MIRRPLQPPFTVVLYAAGTTPFQAMADDIVHFLMTTPCTLAATRAILPRTWSSSSVKPGQGRGTKTGRRRTSRVFTQGTWLASDSNQSSTRAYSTWLTSPWRHSCDEPQCYIYTHRQSWTRGAVCLGQSSDSSLGSLRRRRRRRRDEPGRRRRLAAPDDSFCERM